MVDRQYLCSFLFVLVRRLWEFFRLLLADAALTAVAAGLLVRIFIIFHDCCHGSFFPSRKANEMLGTITGIMTCSPLHQWRHSHSVHHATSGNLDRHGTGDIWTLTVDEYLALPRWKRMAYRLYRNPLIMFGSITGLTARGPGEKSG